MEEIEIIEDEEFNNAPDEIKELLELIREGVRHKLENSGITANNIPSDVPEGMETAPFIKLVLGVLKDIIMTNEQFKKERFEQERFEKYHRHNVKGITYCEKKKCDCGHRKAWNLSDDECEVHRPHGNGIITAKNRATGKYA